MKNDNYIYIDVFIHPHGFVPAGILIFNKEKRNAGFSYLPSYMENNYPPLNPATLNWRENGQRNFLVNRDTNKHMCDRTFWELLPSQSDWGTQIIALDNPEYEMMSHAEKLFFLKNRVVGGLRSFIDARVGEENINSLDWLEHTRSESVAVFMKQMERFSNPNAITPMTSYGGMRPKCTYKDEDGNLWIAKFNLPSDPYDMAITEHVALEMSRAMGLKTSDSKVLTLDSGENVFLSKRFDRLGKDRFHSLSLFALAEGVSVQKTNPAAGGNSAKLIQTLIRRNSDFANQDTINIVTKMLLDLAVNNTDNHLRNLRIILNKQNKWELSPIYDVTFNPHNQQHTYNPGGLPLQELYLNNPKLAKSMALDLGVDLATVQMQVEKVRRVANQWEFFCDKNKMNSNDKQLIANAISLGLNRRNYENTNKITPIIGKIK